MRLNLNKEDISILYSEIFNTVYETLDNGKSIYGIDYVDGHSIAGLWYASSRVRSDNFLKRRDAFLWILEWLLREGRIKLHKNGVFFESSIENQIEAFRKAWPETDKPYPDHPDADFYLWFYDPECPAGIAWRKDDGSYEIAG
jgi:hypothetical protein